MPTNWVLFFINFSKMTCIEIIYMISNISDAKQNVRALLNISIQIKKLIKSRNNLKIIDWSLFLLYTLREIWQCTQKWYIFFLHKRIRDQVTNHNSHHLTLKKKTTFTLLNQKNYSYCHISSDHIILCEYKKKRRLIVIYALLYYMDNVWLFLSRINNKNQ